MRARGLKLGLQRTQLLPAQGQGFGGDDTTLCEQEPR